MKFRLIESKEDQSKLQDYIGKPLADKFFKYKNRFPNDSRRLRDLYTYLKMPKEQAIDIINTELYKIEKQEGLVKDISGWKVYKILSMSMLNNLMGRHIKWCIQNEFGWNLHVNKNGTDYYLYIDTNTKNVYLRGVNSNDFLEDGWWDLQNRSIHDKSLINNLKSIYNTI